MSIANAGSVAGGGYAEKGFWSDKAMAPTLADTALARTPGGKSEFNTMTEATAAVTALHQQDKATGKENQDYAIVQNKATMKYEVHAVEKDIAFPDLADAANKGVPMLENGSNKKYAMKALVVFDDKKGGQFIPASSVSTFGHAGAPKDRDDAVGFANDPGTRTALIQASPQVSPENGKIGDAICGGAAVANALVLTSTDYDSAARNAAAVRAIVAKRGGSLSPAEEKALSNFATGCASPKDMAALQLLMYHLAGGSDGPPPSGVNTRMMTGLASELKGAGAFGNHDVEFLQDRQNIKGTVDQTKHWTCVVDTTHANSWPNDGKNTNGQVGARPEWAAIGKPRCQAVVSVPKTGDIKAQFKDDVDQTGLPVLRTMSVPPGRRTVDELNAVMDAAMAPFKTKAK